MAKIPTVSTYEVNETLLGGYTVSYKCPHCMTELKSKESEIGIPTECPKCGNLYGISRRASRAIELIKLEKQHERDRKQEEKEKRKKCIRCGGPVPFLNTFANRTDGFLCDRCYVDERKELQEKNIREEQEQLEQSHKILRSIIVSTTPFLHGYHVIEYLGIDGVEITVGTGILAEFGAIIKDTFGARSLIMESKLRKARLEAVDMLKRLAFQRGANAVLRGCPRSQFIRQLDN